MKKLLPFALFAIVAATIPALGQKPPIPGPKIVVLDRGAIIQFSKVGRDIAQQLQSLANQNRISFEAQQKSLAAEGQQLRQQVAIMAPEARQKREEAFNEKVRNIQASAERRQTQIQQAAAQSQQVIANALTPIVTEIVKERGANLVVDKGAVIFANNDAFNITADALARLDAKMPSYKVTLGAAPPKP